MIRVLFAFLFVTIGLGGTCSITAPSATAKTWTVQNAKSPNNGVVRTIPRAWEEGDYCLGDNPSTFCDAGNFGQCTSKDIKLASASYVDGPKTCTIGEKIRLTFSVEWVSTANTRYDVSAYIAMDGGDALYGSCYGTILYGNSDSTTSWPNEPTCSDDSKNPPVCAGSNTPIGSASSLVNGPYLEASQTADQCRDLQQNQRTFQTLNNVPFICADKNGDGTADIAACLGWQNNANENGCNGIDRAIVTAGSKCNCETSINIQGLTVCSAQQTLCYGDNAGLNTAPCEPSMSARFRVQSSATATNFPKSAQLFGRVYLFFADSNQRMAIEYFDPAGIKDVAGLRSTVSPTVVREDILWPCKSIQKVKCTSGCTTLFSNNWIPRLFKEGTYAIDTANSKLSPDTNGVTCPNAPWGTSNTTVTGASCALKYNIPNSPATAIDYVWYGTDTAQTSPASRTVLYGARQRDGTFWEFIKESNGGDTCTTTLSVNYPYGMTLAAMATTASGLSTRANPYQLPCSSSATYNWAKFDSLTGCSATQALCTQNAEIAFAIDESQSIALSDWTSYWIPYVWQTTQGFDPNNAQIVFGYCFSAGDNGGQGSYCTPGAMNSDDVSICNSYLKVGTHPSCGGASTLPKVQTTSVTDFRGLINKALDTYFAAASGKPRRLVVLVGSPDAGSTLTWTQISSKAVAAGVQIHAVGIGPVGHLDTTLLINMVGATGGTWSTWSSPNFLPSDTFLYRRLCPASTPVCGCNGFCDCANGVGVCPASCVSSSTSPCNPSVCDTTAPCSGCVANPKVCPNPCFTCDDAAGGTCTKPYVCPDAGQDTFCSVYSCQAVNGKATCAASPRYPAGCTDNDGCTADSCVPGTGCVFSDRSAQLCNDGNGCTDDACIPVTGGGYKCEYTGIQVQQVCGDANACTTDACDSTNGQCTHTTINCDDGNACTSNSCDTVTGCVNAAISCDDGNPCTTEDCDTSTGCTTPVAVTCNDGNPCTDDSCSSTSGSCVFTPKNCDDGKACTVDSCDSTGTCRNDCPAPTCDSTRLGTDGCPATCSDTTGGCSTTIAPVNNLCKYKLCATDSTQCTLPTNHVYDTTLGSFSQTGCTNSFPTPGVYCAIVDKSAVCTTQSDECQTVTCNAVSGSCSFAFRTCNDNNVCTDDSCHSSLGCQYNANGLKTSCDQLDTNDKCNTYTCDAAKGCIVVSNTICNDGNACTDDTCIPATGCNYQLRSCDDSNACTSDSCNTATGVCLFTPIDSIACKGCAASGVSCSATDKCQPQTCIDNCANCDSTIFSNCGSCAVSDTSVFCAVQDKTTPCVARNTDCQTYQCDTSSGDCVSSRSTHALTCDAATLANPCAPSLCVEGARDSSASPVCVTQSSACLGAVISNKCAGVKCETTSDTTVSASGFRCVADTTTRDCTDYTCRANAANGQPAYVEYVVGTPNKVQFEANYASRGGTCSEIQCTVDTCDTVSGCVNSLKECKIPEGTCNATIGCFEAGNSFNFEPGVCQMQPDQSLIDFCQVCFGDSASCFFQTVIPVTTVAAITGGAIAGVVIAAIIAALLIFWLTKKGYDYWQAQSHLASTGLHDNPAYTNPSNQGTMVNE